MKKIAPLVLALVIGCSAAQRTQTTATVSMSADGGVSWHECVPFAQPMHIGSAVCTGQCSAYVNGLLTFQATCTDGGATITKTLQEPSP